MDVRAALKGQYHAGLKMLRQNVELCPDSVWIGGQHPRHPWRIAYHAAFYTHLYLQPREGTFQPWEHHHDSARMLWENPEVLEPYTKEQILGYIDLIDSQVDATVDTLDLSSEDSGFSWYKTTNKLDHQLLNLRHLQGHIGQLSELLMSSGVDTNWVAKAVSCHP